MGLFESERRPATDPHYRSQLLGDVRRTMLSYQTKLFRPHHGGHDVSERWTLVKTHTRTSQSSNPDQPWYHHQVPLCKNVFEQGLDPGNSSEFNIAHGIDLHTNCSRVTQSVLDEFVKPMRRTRKTLHPRDDMLYHWEITFEHTIHCTGEHVFLNQCFNFFHDKIGNEGHVFV